VALTVQELAAAKRLPVEFLTDQLGVADAPGRVVRIPYYDDAGEEVGAKRRPDMDRDSYRWEEGKPIRAYGDWRQHEARGKGWLVLVEGETDSWALWLHGFPALGLPGSGAAGTLTAEHLSGVQDVYVVREPDRGGPTFVAGVARRLVALGYAGRAWVVEMPDGIKDPSALHIDAPAMFNQRMDAALAARAALPVPKSAPPRGAGASRNGHAAAARPTIYRITDLLDMDIPPPKWAVPGLLSEGLSILAGKPKLGKSFWALNLALTIAAGGVALGDSQTIAGDVLYLSLEDRLRRVKDRSLKLLTGLPFRPSGRLHVAVHWPRQPDGGLDHLHAWLQEAENPRLVIIDVWQKFRPLLRTGGSQYEQDYEAASQLKSVFDAGQCSGLIVHHCKKAAAEDVVDEISGTLGLSGAADGLLVLTRARSENEGTLFIDGRDVERRELALAFDPQTCVWKCLGNAAEVTESKFINAIIEVFKRNAGLVLGVNQIAEAVQCSKERMHYLRNTLGRMCDRNLIERPRIGQYRWPVAAADEWAP
jgi:hypothetical protein